MKMETICLVLLWIAAQCFTISTAAFLLEVSPAGIIFFVVALAADACYLAVKFK